MGDGISLDYRRNLGAGTWVARKADGKGGSTQKVIGTADDYQDADGEHVLSWSQAQAKAFAVANASRERLTGKTLSVGEAIERYERDLRFRSGDLGNVARLQRHIPTALHGKAVMELRPSDLRSWRDDLLAHLRPASVNRTCNALKAILNLAADQHEQITSRLRGRRASRPC